MSPAVTVRHLYGTLFPQDDARSSSQDGTRTNSLRVVGAMLWRGYPRFDVSKQCTRKANATQVSNTKSNEHESTSERPWKRVDETGQRALPPEMRERARATRDCFQLAADFLQWGAMPVPIV